MSRSPRPASLTARSSPIGWAARSGPPSRAGGFPSLSLRARAPSSFPSAETRGHAMSHDPKSSELSRRDFLKRSAAGTAAAAAGSRAPLVWAAPPDAPSDRLAMGIIGVGSRGQSGVMQAAQRVKGVEIVGVCDAYKGRVERAIQRTDGRAKDYGDWKALLADKGIDAVIVATPDHWHKTHTIEALNAGKDVYLEKPMTYAIGDGPEMIAAAKRSGRILQIGSQGISSTAQETAREMVA